MIEKSDYFKGLFSSQSKESIINEIKINVNKLDLNAFKLVLNIAHNSHKTEQLLDSLNTSQKLFKVIIISNKYLFCEIERLSSQKFKKSLRRITDLNSFSQIWNFYEKSLALNLNLLNQLFLNYFDENANKLIHHLSRHHFMISAQNLINIFSRDTFGVKEIEIFRTIEKWTKICGFNENLVKTIRLSLIDEIDINFGLNSSKILNKKYFKNTLNEISSGNLVEKSRVSFEPNVMFFINECECNEIIVSETLFPKNKTIANLINFELPIETKINHIKFKLNFERNDYCYPLVYYCCEVCVNSLWIRVIDCSKKPCFGTQEIYFDSLIVSAIRIIGINDGNDRLCVHFCDENLLHYGFIEKALKTNDNSIIPTKDYLFNSDSICLIHFRKINKTFEVTNYVIKNKLYMNSSINYNNYVKFGYETIYLIRLSQPVFVNSLQIEFQLDSHQSVNYLVGISDSFEAFKCITTWNKIVEEFGAKTDSVFIEFSAKQIMSIRISGFRSFDKTFKLPLHIRNVKLLFNTQIQTPLEIQNNSN